jgi:hypothetical protein
VAPGPAENAAPQDGGPLSWVLQRLDDNGNVFEIARFASEPEARAAAEALEARGHKQAYTVSRLRV